MQTNLKFRNMKNIQLILCALLLVTACGQSNNKNDLSKIANEQKTEQAPATVSTETKQVVPEKPLGEVKIIQLEKKVRKGKYYWFTYYVENYFDNKETENKMVEVSKKLPYESSGGFTEVFFFNDKANAPKLANDGGWGDNESQNSWNAKYGKYCVGYYMVGAGESGTFSKGWN